MTQQLIMGLYAEGPTDQRFLRTVISRTAERILAPREIEIPPITPFEARPGIGHRAARILDVAQQAMHFHILFVHSDADAQEWRQARSFKIEPGFRLARAAENGVCKHPVAIIPVQEVEAWMMADPAALAHEIRVAGPLESLGLPSNPALVETIARPKERLQRILSDAQQERPPTRRVKSRDIQEPLAARIDLSRLEMVPAYQAFKRERIHALQLLHVSPNPALPRASDRPRIVSASGL